MNFLANLISSTESSSIVLISKETYLESLALGKLPTSINTERNGRGTMVENHPETTDNSYMPDGTMRSSSGIFLGSNIKLSISSGNINWQVFFKRFMISQFWIYSSTSMIAYKCSVDEVNVIICEEKDSEPPRGSIVLTKDAQTMATKFGLFNGLKGSLFFNPSLLDGTKSSIRLNYPNAVYNFLLDKGIFRIASKVDETTRQMKLMKIDEKDAVQIGSESALITNHSSSSSESETQIYSYREFRNDPGSRTRFFNPKMNEDSFFHLCVLNLLDELFWSEERRNILAFLMKSNLRVRSLDSVRFGRNAVIDTKLLTRESWLSSFYDLRVGVFYLCNCPNIWENHQRAKKLVLNLIIIKNYRVQKTDSGIVSVIIDNP